jgi:hypothetical protein
MKYLVLTLGLLAVAGAAAGFAGYDMSRDSALASEARQRDTMAWLRTEFHLSAGQYAAIDRLHHEYSAVCAGHCQAIMTARARHAPEAEVEALENTCVASMTDHFHRVAALMPPGEGDRYLSLVLPRIAAYDHRGAPSLRGTP